MSRVKKSIVYFVVLALTLVTLAGCGDTEKENEFVGSWEVSSGKRVRMESPFPKKMVQIKYCLSGKAINLLATSRELK